ncbi:helix-turn-helix domain-containing protein [Halomarina oriensis]|uniref:Bacterio-opsin activator n=1 Tax=Halomarina oriensis TaxID=671145 RepID=A0A6B0GPN2_9EURY|nr:helix-turn-helix domain-containing protein [Halomarina oriensis]MWG36792.1 bacterio-opsin activator [Halomarina oriensis]
MSPDTPGKRPHGTASLPTTREDVTDGRVHSDPTVAELRLRAAAFALAQTFDRRPTLNVRVEQVAASRPTRPFTSVWLSDTDVDAALDALADDPSVGVEAVVTRRQGSALCELAFPRRVSVVVDVVTSRAGTVLSATATGGAWSLRIRYPTREALSETVTALDRFGVDPTLSRVGCRSGSPVGDLTEKQRQTVATAFERGYFEIPRKVSLTELAADLDVTHQALSERLRRAEQALLRAEFGGACPEA